MVSVIVTDISGHAEKLFNASQRRSRARVRAWRKVGWLCGFRKGEIPRGNWVGVREGNGCIAIVEIEGHSSKVKRDLDPTYLNHGLNALVKICIYPSQRKGKTKVIRLILNIDNICDIAAVILGGREVRRRIATIIR
jgi:hypothetical protein